MAEYRPPCMDGLCDTLGKAQSGPNQRLCQGIGKSIIGADGAGLLEVTVCPMQALMRVGPEQTDPRMIELRANLGITKYWEGIDLLDY